MNAVVSPTFAPSHQPSHPPIVSPMRMRSLVMRHAVFVSDVLRTPLRVSSNDGLRRQR
jgi:hypothetical protein